MTAYNGTDLKTIPMKVRLIAGWEALSKILLQEPISSSQALQIMHLWRESQVQLRKETADQAWASWDPVMARLDRQTRKILGL